MLPLVRSALSRLSVRSVQHVAKGPKLKRKKPDFHDSYGTLILVSGTLWCLGTWSYALTHYDLDHYLSPVGAVRPKDWKRQ
ncbi:cytochrome c oxidase subunit 7B, mitochondrial-like [Trichosurus vulpecula]|uniref:cytochrome c oxidase subunit 7B, mitochondrial-like n=1 Tax=Trichosurus vulpecula TaxID=9337 RepID=UPI00186B0EFB|nr:cytochrome c oxidase subunit 7B, mitochondrial-like [Trichosurus vulpecula]